MSAADERFRTNFAWLLSYREAHGTLNVPRRVDKEMQRLSNWVAECRAKYKRGKLAPAYIVELEAVGFQWSLSTGGRSAPAASVAVPRPTPAAAHAALAKASPKPRAKAVKAKAVKSKARGRITNVAAASRGLAPEAVYAPPELYGGDEAQ